jgi:hypothetical protein
MGIVHIEVYYLTIYPPITFCLTHYLFKWNSLEKFTFNTHEALPKWRARLKPKTRSWNVLIFYKKSSRQTPSLFSNLNSHLLSKHLFLYSKSSTPNPPHLTHFSKYCTLLHWLIDDSPCFLDRMVLSALCMLFSSGFSTKLGN